MEVNRNIENLSAAMVFPAISKYSQYLTVVLQNDLITSMQSSVKWNNGKRNNAHTDLNDVWFLW